MELSTAAAFSSAAFRSQREVASGAQTARQLAAAETAARQDLQRRLEAIEEKHRQELRRRTGALHTQQQAALQGQRERHEERLMKLKQEKELEERYRAAVARELSRISMTGAAEPGGVSREAPAPAAPGAAGDELVQFV